MFMNPRPVIFIVIDVHVFACTCMQCWPEFELILKLNNEPVCIIRYRLHDTSTY